MSEVFASPKRPLTAYEKRLREQGFRDAWMKRVKNGDATVSTLIDEISRLSTRRIQQDQEVKMLKTKTERLEKEIIDLRSAGGIPRDPNVPPLVPGWDYDPEDAHGDVVFVRD